MLWGCQGWSLAMFSLQRVSSLIKQILNTVKVCYLEFDGAKRSSEISKGSRYWDWNTLENVVGTSSSLWLIEGIRDMDVWDTEVIVL